MDWKGLEFEKLREVFRSVGFVSVAVVGAEIWVPVVVLKKSVLMGELTW